MNDKPAVAGRARPWRWSWRWGGVTLLLALVAAFAAAESLGWPFLAGPVERAASRLLGRAVSLTAADTAGSTPSTPFQVRFLGGLHLSAPTLRIAAPDWSTSPYLLAARDVTLDMRYADLWQARQGGRLRVKRLQAAWLEAWLERLADGRASWQFAALQAPPGAPPADTPMPVFDSLQVAAGQLRVHDVPLAVELQAQLSLVDGALPAAPAASGSMHAASVPGSAASATSLDPATSRLQVSARGSFREFPLKIELTSTGVLPWVAASTQSTPVPLSLTASVGRARLVFQGTALDALHLGGLSGHYRLQGPSLAAVGDPVGVTLPTTAAFSARGKVVEQHGTWNVVIDDATVGASRLNGAFTYTRGRPVPLLAGRLGGKRLLLADLGPALGTGPTTLPGSGTAPALAAAASAAPAPAAGARAGTARHKPAASQAKVLPDRPFDLAALRVMDAQVVIAIDEVTLTTPVLEPFRPLRAHLQLVGGVLTLTEIDARTGQGRLWGDLQLDGRGSEALWRAGLFWDGVRLEHWIRQTRSAAAPPYVAGRLQGRLDLTGQGRSTAGILASLSGTARAELHEGAVSHLAIEVGGLDIAQGLGMMIKGDDALPVQCAVSSLVADHGVFRPQVMVLDTTDSTVVIDGSVSLAAETLDLRAVVIPKDFSPMTLRTPLRVSGSFQQPELQLDKAPLARTVAASVLLAFINPLAALIPLIDPGKPEEARRAASGCRQLMHHPALRATAAPAAGAKARTN